MNIPFVDLKSQYLTIKEEIDTAIGNVISETAFIGGKYATAFENDFKTDYGVENCIACANGTDAIYIVLKMLGIGEGDEVITTSCTWISTSETIAQTGATPIFVDIDEFHLIDLNKIEEKITSKTKAIIPVHLFGQMVDVVALNAICKKHNLFMIEDCAQAHYSSIQGIRAGHTGIAATFSFYPGKNLGAYGDAGAIITNNDELAIKCRQFANHGSLQKHEHVMTGINSRMDGIQAAILSVKLKHIHQWTAQRQKIAEKYKAKLADIAKINIVPVQNESKPVYHLFVIEVENRDSVMEKLQEQGIGTAIHYPMPQPFLQAYKEMNHQFSDFPIAFEKKDKILSLPIYPEMTDEQISYVCEKLIDIVTKN